MTRLIVLASASFAVIGACLTLPGTLLPLLVVDFDIRLVEAGSMLALQQIGYLLSVVIGARRVIERFGLRAVVSYGLLLFGSGVGAFGTVPGWLGGAVAMFASGLGFGAMEVAINTLIIEASGPRRSNMLNLTHLFFGVGSFIAPVLVTRAVTAGAPWRTIFVLTGVLTAAVGLAWRSLPFGGRVEADTASRPPAPAHLRSALIMLLAATLGVYVGVEVGVGSWLTQYLVTVRATSLTFAGNALSVYWLGLAGGRLVLSVLAHRAAESLLVFALTLVATVSLAAGVLVGDARLAMVCFGATGIGYSGIFPGVIALGGRVHPQQLAAVTSVLVAGAGMGSIVIPWLMSAIADGFGLTAGMGFFVVMTAVMSVLAAIVHQRVTRAHGGELDGD